MNKISLRLYILSLLFSTAGVFAFADQPSSSLDDKPSVDTAANAGVQVPAVARGHQLLPMRTPVIFTI